MAAPDERRPWILTRADFKDAESNKIRFFV
jgi:hypothetical protein